MTAVLGTAVIAGADVARAVLISDLHLAVGGGALDGFDAALAYTEQRGATLFVLGDLFDSYVSKAQVRVGIWRDVAVRLAAATARGLPVVLLVGNRDFLLGDEFAFASGVRLVHGGYRARLGGLDTLLLHGDELCQNDLPYQRARRWLRSAPVRLLARRLPLRLAERLAERARQRSRAVVRSGDQSRFLPSGRAVARAFETGVERLVFGHIHRHATGSFGDDGARYHVLPAFDEQSIGLCFEAGEVTPHRFAGPGPVVPVAAPPPCPWSV